MLREELNLISDALLSLVPLKDRGPEDRKLLIEEAAGPTSREELIQDWIGLHGSLSSAVLKVKLWLGMDYAQIGKLLSLTHREVSQLLKMERSLRLPNYPAKGLSQDSTQIAGLSCFMVEQYLSAWIDSEIWEVSLLQQLERHLGGCEACRQRRLAYRELQEQLFKERQAFDPISEEEWRAALEEFELRRRRQAITLAGYFLGIVFVAALLSWAFWSKPDKMPNVYEIEER